MCGHELSPVEDRSLPLSYYAMADRCRDSVFVRSQKLQAIELLSGRFYRAGAVVRRVGAGDKQSLRIGVNVAAFDVEASPSLSLCVNSCELLCAARRIQVDKAQDHVIVDFGPCR